ncbi:uncharacterized protein LOC124256977 [Haliotis rubra]|uniref:uncharacterized protein LOC124256977 n=1 Tax=Haliotis rubra TaxID=36100 RepID=UPI001EE5F29A|nr:uncharacterized protein LOC124256977 [Haliotis rubra]
MKRDIKSLLTDQKFTVTELKDAETSIVRFIQSEHYRSEINDLRKSGSVNRNSGIRRLSPFLHDGLLHVGGRLSRARISEDMKHPILIPCTSPISILIIREIHENSGHIGRSQVLSTLRQRYWITKANSTVRSVINKCTTCRRYKRQTSTQLMSDLPEKRVNPAPPFAYCGVDFFGPHTVKEGRKSVKRYGALFTCFTSRAIHIEVANSLSTDSFIQALRRFIARRGPVQEIHCDNGTNFTGAAKELEQSVQEMDQSRLHEYLLKSNISWKFNPPTASHMGGVWERLIRSVRTVLNPLLREFGERIDDESYRTLLTEVEGIVNSRPLTTSSDDPLDLQPLTPNHLLMVKTQVFIPPPGTFQRNDVYMRQRWRCVQHLTNLFWTRWKNEYLLTLQKRQSGMLRNVTLK